MDETRWKACLEEYQPQVIVSAWSTPLVPAAWLLDTSEPARYICHIVGSVRNVVPRAFLENGGLVTNWGGSAAFSVAEHALLLALLQMRNVLAWRPYIESAPETRGGSIEAIRARSLCGRTVGLHGFGAVARALVELLAPFRVSVYAYSEGVPESIYHKAGVHRCDSLAELFSKSEILFECEALTEKTRGCVTAEILRQLPEGAVLVNVGRGQVIDEAALIREVRTSRLRIASDVAAEEPLTADSLLYGVSGVVLSPHIAGPTFEGYAHCGDLALKNVECFLRGKTPEGVVSLDIYDRMT